MRRETIICKTLRTAKRRAPWAVKLAKVCGGWIAFESLADYETWRRQT